MVGPKCYHKYFYKRDKDITQTHRGGRAEMEQRSVWPQAKEWRHSGWELKEVRNGFSSGASRESATCQHLDFGLQTRERPDLCCFNPPNWWSFVIASPRNESSGGDQIIM